MSRAPEAEQDSAAVGTKAMLTRRLERTADIRLQAVLEGADRVVVRRPDQPINILITWAGMAARNGAAAIPEHVVVFAERIPRSRCRGTHVRSDHLGHRPLRRTGVIGALFR